MMIFWWLLLHASIISVQAELDSALALLNRCQPDTKFQNIRLHFGERDSDPMLELKKTTIIDLKNRFFEAAIK